ncbi:MAG: endopeptidase La, partial [Sphingomonas bacterium]|nr:endopeptidase La [Sphingomonas bacterium]
IPAENEKDLVDIPVSITGGLEIVPVRHVDEVLARALVTPLVPIEWTEADELAAAQVAAIAQRDAGTEGAIRH